MAYLIDTLWTVYRSAYRFFFSFILFNGVLDWKKSVFHWLLLYFFQRGHEWSIFVHFVCLSSSFKLQLFNVAFASLSHAFTSFLSQWCAQSVSTMPTSLSSCLLCDCCSIWLLFFIRVSNSHRTIDEKKERKEDKMMTTTNLLFLVSTCLLCFEKNIKIV